MDFSGVEIVAWSYATLTFTDASTQDVIIFDPSGYVYNPDLCADTYTNYPTVTTVTENVNVVPLSGFLNLAVTGGVTPYSYNWTTGETTEDIYVTQAGTYSVTVYSGGCGQSQTVSATVVEPVLDAVVTDDNCGAGSGAIDLTLTDFTTPSFVWNTTATTEDLSGLFAGTYSVTISFTSCPDIDFSYDVLADNQAPVPDIAVLADVTGECSATVSTTPTATDVCSGAITGTTMDPLFYDVVGVYTVTWNYDDGDGNVATQTQTVIVEDMTAPVADVAVLADVIGECDATVTFTPTATDNCEGMIYATTMDALYYDMQGVYTVTWTYDDGNGNITTQDQTVIVEDITAPVADVAVLADVIGECDATVTFTPTATDNCEGMIYATTMDALYYDLQGVYTVTWTYDDGNGNITTQDQTVIVEDMTAPTITCVENQIIDLTEGQTTYSVTGTEFDAMADDNCTVASFENDLNMTSTLSGEELMAGTYSVTWTVMDAAGNMEICTMEIVVNPYVGLQSIDNINVSVYPNPTSGVLNITNAEGYKVVITDVSGRTIQSVEANTDNLKVDLSNNADGMYFIQFINNGVVSTVKIMKK